MILVEMTIFILIMSIFHELGHYVVARYNRLDIIHVQIGSGFKICTWKGKEHTTSFHVIPYGGYVELADREEKREEYASWETISSTQFSLFCMMGPIFQLLITLLYIPFYFDSLVWKFIFLFSFITILLNVIPIPGNDAWDVFFNQKRKLVKQKG